MFNKVDATEVNKSDGEDNSVEIIEEKKVGGEEENKS